jgi:hypothetical protein
MSRFNVAVLLFILTLPAFSQESDTVHAIHNADTLSSIQNLDSIYQFAESGFLVSDSLVVSDSVQEEVREPKSPSRALMYAMVLPGMGQAYNRKYYKIPIVWGALGVGVYSIVYNTKKYEEATRDYLQDETDTHEAYMKGYRRNMELSYIVTALLYGLQMLDAYVDANLYTWDVNDNLSMRVAPSLQPMMSPTSLSGLSGGLTCSFKIRGR